MLRFDILVELKVGIVFDSVPQEYTLMNEVASDLGQDYLKHDTLAQSVPFIFRLHLMKAAVTLSSRIKCWLLGFE